MSQPFPPSARPPAVYDDAATSAWSPTPGRVEVLEAGHRGCCSTAAARPASPPSSACSAWPRPCSCPRTKVLLLSRSHRQSTELFRMIADFYRRLGEPPAASAATPRSCVLANGSRIVCLPCKEDDHPRLLRRQPADHRRGGPRARRPVPGRPADAGRLATAG